MTSNIDTGVAPETFNATVTIASSGTVSTALDLYGTTLAGILFPAAMTGTTITFQGSVDGTTFKALYNSNGSALSATIAQDTILMLQPSDFAGLRWLKIVSGSTEGSTRTLTLLTREVA